MNAKSGKWLTLSGFIEVRSRCINQFTLQCKTYYVKINSRLANDGTSSCHSTFCKARYCCATVLYANVSLPAGWVSRLKNGCSVAEERQEVWPCNVSTHSACSKSLLHHWYHAKVYVDGFHSIFSLGNWTALHHHAPCRLVNIHITWPSCPPVSVVKDAIEFVYRGL